MKKQATVIKRIRRKQRKAFESRRGELRMPTAVHGHVSSQIGLIAVAAFFLLLLIAYLTHGGSAAILGALGLIVVMLCIVGVFHGILGLGEPNKDQKASKRGLVLNITVLIILLLIFFGGLRSV